MIERFSLGDDLARGRTWQAKRAKKKGPRAGKREGLVWQGIGKSGCSVTRLFDRLFRACYRVLGAVSPAELPFSAAFFTSLTTYLLALSPSDLTRSSLECFSLVDLKETF